MTDETKETRYEGNVKESQDAKEQQEEKQETKEMTEQEKQQEAINQYLKRANEILNLEEITITYKGVREPKNTSQLSVEINALSHLVKTIQAKISALEYEWSVVMERQRIAEALIKSDRQATGQVPGEQENNVSAESVRPVEPAKPHEQTGPMD